MIRGCSDTYSELAKVDVSPNKQVGELIVVLLLRDVFEAKVVAMAQA
jgi:hypothetical protein